MSKTNHYPFYYKVIASLLIVILTSIITLQAQTGKGTITGTIRSGKGEPLSGINVGLEGTTLGEATDTQGKFTIRNVEEGSYTLVASGVGYTASKQNVTVQAGKTTRLSLQIDESTHQLNEIVVTETNAFARKETEYVARMPLKNMENPQVYTVVTKDIMKEQVVTERTDIYLNVPGAVPNFLAGGSQGMSMRGFASTVGMRNGMVTSAVVPLNPIILQRLEVLKGPTGTLFGGNRNVTFGGVYNYVTKQPFEEFAGEVSYTTGSFNLSRITADVNTPLTKDKAVLFRLNAGWQSEGSFQDQGYSKNYTFAPSFSYQASKRLKFLVDMDFTRGTFTTTAISIGSLSRVTARSFKDLPLQYNRSYINDGIDINNGINNIQARIEYKISDQWTSQTNYLYSEGFYKNFLWTTLSMQTDSTFLRTVRNQKPETFGNTQFQQNFIGDFMIGSFRNRIVAGFDYNNNYNKLNRVTLTYDTVNLNRPLPNINADKLDELAYKRGFTSTATQTNSYGLYASDVFSISPQLMIMLSLRVDRFATDGTYTVTTDQRSGAYKQTSLSPKLGIVYQPVKDRVAVFANYMNGFNNLAPVLQPDSTLLILKPQYGNQFEGGVKLDMVRNRLNATISYYNISVTNSTRTGDVNGRTFMYQDGTQRSKGVEVEVIANPVNGLNIIAGYAYNENKYTKSIASLEGKSLVASPKHVGNIWASYHMTKGAVQGLGLGIGANYVSDAWLEATNTFKLPGYTLVNATLFYDQPRYRLAIKANNLLDQQYWNSNGTPQKPFNILANVAFRF
ncbi:TonB-dependent receptor [Cytophagaceae bacterium DM2B3-1]|uniref:TonB-dependent receptor n=1 Tax=Xanthocytophaga flava TaxID=3048013 RepID=A0ABT7CUF9_9BACT|nr:TonB-dependent receptor [Xanthocytophaga flavus]MDJ1496580.1 TonB-dependent receptor [Xanthocytophaga flavus]